MRNWIAFVQKHHDIIVLPDNTIYLPLIGYTADGKWVDHHITKEYGFYTVEEYYHDTGEYALGWTETSIKEYLGY
jgi:hypothetical protein